MYTNLPKISDDKHPKGSFTAMHGMRAITVTWVILVHTYFFYAFVAGKEYSINIDENFRYQLCF